jgi:hypothetical protein
MSGESDIKTSAAKQESAHIDWIKRAGKWSIAIGVITMIVNVVIMAISILGSQKIVERANQRVADLLAQVGAAEQRAKGLEAELTKADELVSKLKAADTSKVQQVLELSQSPELANALKAGVLEKQIQQLGMQVGHIYASASYAMRDEHYHEADLFPLLLNSMYKVVEPLKGQRKTGAIATSWVTDQKTWEIVVGQSRAEHYTRFAANDNKRPDATKKKTELPFGD